MVVVFFVVVFYFEKSVMCVCCVFRKNKIGWERRNRKFCFNVYSVPAFNVFVIADIYRCVGGFYFFCCCSPLITANENRFFAIVNLDCGHKRVYETVNRRGNFEKNNKNKMFRSNQMPVYWLHGNDCHTLPGRFAIVTYVNCFMLVIMCYKHRDNDQRRY